MGRSQRNKGTRAEREFARLIGAASSCCNESNPLAGRREGGYQCDKT